MFSHICPLSRFSTIWYLFNFFLSKKLQIHNPDFVCLQEAYRRQSGDLAKELNYDHHESWMTCSILSRIPYKLREYRSVFIITFIFCYQWFFNIISILTMMLFDIKWLNSNSLTKSFKQDCQWCHRMKPQYFPQSTLHKF